MPKDSSKAVGICEKISKGAIYLLIFLLPLFLLPWTVSVLDFNKQILLMVLVFISLFAWMLKTLISEKLSINLTGLHIPVAVLFLVYLISTIFSLWRYGSFWGWPQITSESLVSLISLLLLYFLVSNIFSKKEIFYSVLLLAVSGFLAMLYEIFQLFGIFIPLFNFTKFTSFNTLGSVSSLGFFIAVLAPLTMVLLMSSRKFLRIIFALAMVLILISLVLINFSIAWWVVVIGSALIMIFGMQKRDLFDSRWLALPMFFLAVSLFFTFFRIQIGGLPQRAMEFYLTQKTTFDISLKTLKESPILGSGPGTFAYDFTKYKKTDFNQSVLWNTKFESGGSRVLNTLATTGILGVLALLFLIAAFLFYGIKFLAKGIKSFKEDNLGEEANRFLWRLGLGIFGSLTALSAGYFLYNTNLSLEFVFFLLLSLLIVLISRGKKEYSLKPASLLTLSVTFVFTLVFIFSLGLFILEGQRYVAEISYFKGLTNLQAGKIDGAMGNMEKAVSLNPKSDLYFRDLSQIYLQKLNQEIAREDISKDEVAKRAQTFFANAINASKIASDINPNNVSNWSTRGFVYQSLIGTTEGVKDWAIQMYDQALKLEPLNPYFPTQKGLSILKEAYLLANDKKDEKAKLFEEAKAQFDIAVGLKSDYAPARFQIAMVYQAEGKTEDAIKQMEDTKQYAPSDVGLAFQIGLLYYQNKDYQKAQTEFERAIGINPNYANGLYFLGLTYDQLGNKQKAIEEIQKVAQLNPDNEEVKKVLANLQAGKSALEGIVQEVPPQAPVEEKPAEQEPAAKKLNK